MYYLHPNSALMLAKIIQSELVAEAARHRRGRRSGRKGRS